MKIQKYLRYTMNGDIVIETVIEKEAGFGIQSMISEKRGLFLILYFCNFIEGLTLCLVSDNNEETLF